MNEQELIQVEEDLDTRESINLETAKIAWKDVQVNFASGNVISVSPELDLIDVALVITNDDSEHLKAWTEQGLVDAVTDDQAKEFHDDDASVWAVVIKPWILIQPATNTKQTDP
jgi:hypothetical protein